MSRQLSFETHCGRYIVEIAENGELGLQALMSQRYDLCLCDIDMPVMNGLTCVQRLRAWEEENRTDKGQTMCCVTGEHSMTDEAIRGAGFDFILRKHYTAEKLQALIADTSRRPMH